MITLMLHCQRDHVTYLAERGAHWILTGRSTAGEGAIPVYLVPYPMLLCLGDHSLFPPTGIERSRPA